jgi:predicted amidohydrolase YtcJ
VRGAGGEPTGVFQETAQGLVERAIESPGLEEWKRRRLRQIELAGRECLEKGITSFHDAGDDPETIGIYRELAASMRLPVRLYVMVRAHRGGPADTSLANTLKACRTDDLGGGFLTVRCVKVTMDGALGSRGAWLLAPYSDQPGSTGMAAVPPDELERTARVVKDAGYQLAVHAIGDRANRAVLDVYQKLEIDRGDHRWRIEHAQHLDPADIPRFGKLGVIASMQGIHCTSDGPWVEARLGAERTRAGAYAWRALLDSGARVINGTDTPVEDVDPLACFRASVTRRMNGGAEFHPGQKMTRMEALASYTRDAAFAAFQEKDKGTLAVGKMTDVTVLSRDILTIPDDALEGTKVAFTIVNGTIRYRAIESPAEE